MANYCFSFLRNPITFCLQYSHGNKATHICLHLNCVAINSVKWISLQYTEAVLVTRKNLRGRVTKPWINPAGSKALKIINSSRRWSFTLYHLTWGCTIHLLTKSRV